MAHTRRAPRRIYCHYVCDGQRPMDCRAPDKRAFSEELSEGHRRRTVGCGSDCRDGRAWRSTAREGGQAVHRFFYVAGGRSADCATDGHNQFDADRRPPEFEDTWSVRPGGKDDRNRGRHGCRGLLDRARVAICQRGISRGRLRSRLER